MKFLRLLGLPILVLGLIAGIGMLIAFATSVTLLPALLSVLKPPSEPEQLGYSALAPVDSFLERHRIAPSFKARSTETLEQSRHCTRPSVATISWCRSLQTVLG